MPIEFSKEQVAALYEANTGREWSALDSTAEDFVFGGWNNFEFFLRYIYYPHELYSIWTEENAERTRLCEFQSALAYICQYEAPKYGKVTIEAPTGSSKTDTVGKGYVLWRVCRDRRIRIGLYGHDEGKTDRHMSAFQSHLENNKAIHDVFGLFYDEHHRRKHMWNLTTMQVRGCGGFETVRAATYGGESEGHPFDIVVCDDVQGRKESSTPEQREKAWSWKTEVVKNRLRVHTDDPEYGIIISIGTRQNPGDIHARCREQEDWKCFWFPAIIKDAVVKDASRGYGGRYELIERNGRIVPVELWDNYEEQPMVLIPEWPDFTYAALCRERDLYPGQFARKKQNLVRDEGSKLFPQELLMAYCRADGGKDPDGQTKPLLRAWNIHEGKPDRYPLEFPRRILSVDLAATAKTKGRYDPDYTVLLLLGVTERKHRVVLDVLRFRTSSPARQRELLLRAYEAYRPTIPPVVETNACQKLWAKDVTEQVGIPVRMEELKSSKLDEIESLADLAYSGRFWYAWDERDPHTMQVMRAFEDEITSYPDVRHDDQLTALLLAERQVLQTGEVEVTLIQRREAAPQTTEPTPADEEIDEAALARRFGIEKDKVASLEWSEIQALDYEGRIRKRTRRRPTMPEAAWLRR